MPSLACTDERPGEGAVCDAGSNVAIVPSVQGSANVVT